MKNLEAGGMILLIFAGVMAIVFGPIVAIWAINVLFNAGIKITLKNWLAMLLLIMLAKASGGSRRA